jgi:hypothetical protein
MREFTKSLMSYTWAMSLFGVQQVVNVLTPKGQQQQQHPAAEAFNEVADATREQMGDVLKSTYRAGDNVQRGMVDVMFSVMTLGMFDRNGGARAASNVGQQSAEAVRQGFRAMGQAADAVTHGAYAAAASATQAATSAAASAASSGAGWGPAPDGSTRASGQPPPQDHGGASGHASGAGAHGGGGQQAQGWGPMPS